MTREEIARQAAKKLFGDAEYHGALRAAFVELVVPMLQVVYDDGYDEGYAQGEYDAHRIMKQ